jgi:hypothetical protein
VPICCLSSVAPVPVWDCCPRLDWFLNAVGGPMCQPTVSTNQYAWLRAWLQDRFSDQAGERMIRVCRFRLLRLRSPQYSPLRLYLKRSSMLPPNQPFRRHSQQQSSRSTCTSSQRRTPIFPEPLPSSARRRRQRFRHRLRLLEPRRLAYLALRP